MKVQMPFASAVLVISGCQLTGRERLVETWRIEEEPRVPDKRKLILLALPTVACSGGKVTVRVATELVTLPETFMTTTS